MNQPTPQVMMDWLTGPLTSALHEHYGPIQLSFLSSAAGVVDGTTVLLIRDAAGRPRAVALCSSPVAPDMVRRAMTRAHAAKAALGASTGAPILDPVTAGSVNGLSYAVLPYCGEFSRFRLARWYQRHRVRQPVLDWLFRVNQRSVRHVEPGAIDSRFAEPLRRLASLKELGGSARDAAKQAIGRLDAGAWVPGHVLMHGDLWKGNILFRPSGDPINSGKWSDRFVVIDWAGSEIQGYALYDLVRFAESTALSDSGLRTEVARHCQLLGCDRGDAKSYLLAALGHIYMNLEHFPLPSFIRMSETCLATLERSMTH